ncbi:MAG: type I-C CRISPR-associated protein Cas7/Csd2 [Armatimonadetes bacterium]|nr:type I-C CRISPR-associated protein Cas7/Csd2 [Armatimonadota bacterium]
MRLDRRFDLLGKDFLATRVDRHRAAAQERDAAIGFDHGQVAGHGVAHTVVGHEGLGGLLRILVVFERDVAGSGDLADLAAAGRERHSVLVQNNGVALNDMHKRAYTALNLNSTGTKQKREEVQQVRKWMCENFYDIRMFGAVMTTEVNCGQVRGPVQLTFARSIDPITPLDIAITRVAVTKSQDAQVVVGEEGKTEGKVTEMGRKALLPYGLYLSRGFFSPKFAKDTGVTKDDLSLFWEALVRMWDLDHSAARGFMSLRGLYVFSHENPLGNAHAHELFAKLRVERKSGIEAPRSFDDYKVELDEEMPDDVTLTRVIG